jgi:hypothetical protein
VWKRYADGNLWYKTTIVTDHSGNVFIGGQMTGTTAIDFHGAVITPTIGGHMGFVAKYDASGNVVWAKIISSGSLYYLNDMCLDGNGNIYLSGYFLTQTCNFGTTVLTNYSNITPSGYVSDLVTVKLDAQGNITWIKQAGGTGNDLPHGITCDTQGNIFIAGGYEGTAAFDTLHVSSHGNSDVFVVGYDTSGNALWVKTAGGISVEHADAIAASPKGSHLFITGDFVSNPTVFENDTLRNASNTLEIFVAEIGKRGSGINTGVSELSFTANVLAVVPNPFTKEAVLFSKKDLKNAELMIYNSLGQAVQNEHGIHGKEFGLKRGQLPAGIYFVVLTEENELPVVHRIVVND